MPAPHKIRTATLLRAINEESQILPYSYNRGYRSKIELLKEARRRTDISCPIKFIDTLKKFVLDIKSISIAGDFREQTLARHLALHEIAEWVKSNKIEEEAWWIRKEACKILAEINHVDIQYLDAVATMYSRFRNESDRANLEYELIRQTRYYIHANDPSSILTAIVRVTEMDWRRKPDFIRRAQGSAYQSIANWARYCKQEEIAENIEALIVLSQ